MIVYYTILLNIILFPKFLKGDVIVQDAGTMPVEKDDIGLIFYITLFNNSKCRYHITTKMIKCFEMIDNEQEFKTVNLIGADVGVIDPHTSMNATLIFPNLYLMNRYGSCSTIVKYYRADSAKARTYTIQRDIPFNTSTSIEPCTKYCATVDLEPKFNCAPVDCMVKYSGIKSFFNRDTQKCEEVPQCIADLDKCMPDVAYMPLSNKCKDLNKQVSKLELQILENENYKDCGKEFIYTNFICHNGVVDNTTKQCVCFDGWTSSLDCDYRPSLGVYHLCNIEIGGWVNINRSKINMTFFLISILAVTIASKLLFAMCILHMCYNWARKKDADDGSEEKPTTGESYEEQIQKRNKSDDKNTETPVYAGDMRYTRSPYDSKKSIRSRTSSSGDIKIFVEQTSESNTTANYSQMTESEVTEQSSTAEDEEEEEDEEIVLEYSTDLSENFPKDIAKYKSITSTRPSSEGSNTLPSKHTISGSENILTAVSFDTTMYEQSMVVTSESFNEASKRSSERKRKDINRRSNVKFDIVVSNTNNENDNNEFSQATSL